MGSFLWPGSQAHSQDIHRASATIHVAARSRDYHTVSAVLPTTTQMAYSMWKACAHTKESDHVAKLQEALNNSIVLYLNGSVQTVSTG